MKTLSVLIGLDIQESVTIRKNSGRYLISDYKLREIVEKKEKVKAEVILIEPELPPRDKINIIKATKADVIDRTLLLLEVFESNAGSKEAKLQISLARSGHMLPLVREVLNNSKRGELPGFLAGGTYAIDKYYRQLRRQVAKTRRELEEIRIRRDILRERRRVSGLSLIAIIGYANAGKTTLFNLLTGSNKETSNKPFTTISPKVSLSNLGFLVIDTVGFVMNVPPEIIEAFYSTLEEIREADVLLLLLDSTEDLFLIEERVKQASVTLSNIESLYKPIVVALNKVEKTGRDDIEEKRAKLYQTCKSVFPMFVGLAKVSAKKGLGIDEMVNVIWKALNRKQAY
ncbi:GTPase HflX [Fervidicoccus fontis]|uniref:GTPase HflX n=1 Tax=Fervidicoccus fontis TaxID=683846 RepID=A0A843AKZ9_9CREN|nr:GTPase [Fervidicoccus fontis]MBE9391601.1 GTPase HflX [Fervidicoccus fontis]